MSVPSPEEIHALLAEAFNNGDLDAFVEMHEVDAMTIAPPDGRQANGRNEIRAALEPVFALRPRVTNEVLNKLENDGLALTQARWSLVGTDPGGERVEMEGEGTVDFHLPNRSPRDQDRRKFSAEQQRDQSVQLSLRQSDVLGSGRDP